MDSLGFKPSCRPLPTFSSVVITVHESVSVVVVGRVALGRADPTRVPIAHFVQNVLIGGSGRALAQNPCVIPDLVSVQTRVRVSNEQLADEILSLSRDGLPGRRAEVVIAPFDLLK